MSGRHWDCTAQVEEGSSAVCSSTSSLEDCSAEEAASCHADEAAIEARVGEEVLGCPGLHCGCSEEVEAAVAALADTSRRI